MRLFIVVLFMLSVSSCSVIDVCFHSHLATNGRKYDNYGKNKSGAKSFSRKKVKGNSKSKKDEYASENLPSYARNVARPSKVYTKEQLKIIKKQNKHFYKMHKSGKGKFRYPYQIASPYRKEIGANDEKTKEKPDNKG